LTPESSSKYAARQFKSLAKASKVASAITQAMKRVMEPPSNNNLELNKEKQRSLATQQLLLLSKSDF
jgi:hypothetical protein